MRRPTFSLLLALVAALAARGRADVFELKDGGQVTGNQVERTDSGDYVIRTADGATITLEQNQVQRLVIVNVAAAEHERRSRAAPDTAEAHRELAAWCREHELLEEADQHLERVVELDPADEAARESLGLQKVGDRWVTRDELMVARGLVFFDGKYRTPQDAAIRQASNAEGDVEAEWFQKLRLWRGWLDGKREERVAEARAQIAAVNDPRAAPALIKLLDSEEDDWAFELLLHTLGQLDDARAVQALVDYSLEDDDAEIRAQCLDYLTSAARAVSIFPYVQALRSKDNVIVNRAGEALAVIGDPAAISPLIDALVTVHKFEIQPQGPGSGPGGISAGFDPSGGSGGGLSMGGKGPQIIKKRLENPAVLRALMKLSGNQSFDYDTEAWRGWFVDMQMRQHANARRDM